MLYELYSSWEEQRESSFPSKLCMGSPCHSLQFKKESYNIPDQRRTTYLWVKTNLKSYKTQPNCKLNDNNKVTIYKMDTVECVRYI
jgi:hypothetical protein